MIMLMGDTLVGTMGARIRELRHQKKLRQRRLASTVGIGHSHMSLIESDTNRPSVEVLERIAAALDTTTDFLLLKTDDPSRCGD